MTNLHHQSVPSKVVVTHDDVHTFDQINESVSRTFEILIPERIGRFKTQPKSPIERSFLIGLMTMNYFVLYYHFSDEAFWQKNIKSRSVLVELQAPVLTFFADFLLTLSIGEEIIGKIVVECDGHAFHERTKQQAAHDRSRDRAMLLAGFQVMRFTGSELYANLMSCVAEVNDAVCNLWADKPSKIGVKS